MEDVREKLTGIEEKVLLQAYEKMCQARSMSSLFEKEKALTSKYVHATSKGHEALQLSLALQLHPQDFIYPYYRDDSILLGIGFSPYDLMLQLMAKGADPFSGGRTYYCHPSSVDVDKPKIPHQSSATGMQAIPATGAAHGLRYLEKQNLRNYAAGKSPVVVCSLGDGSMTEGEVSEAMQMAVLKELPILYFVQDNEWDISASAKEVRAMTAAEYAKGFKGLRVESVDGTDFFACYRAIAKILGKMRTDRHPYLLHARVPLLNHHTSGVRMEWYRSEDDLASHRARDPFPRFRGQLIEAGIDPANLAEIEKSCEEQVLSDFEKAKAEDDPHPEEIYEHIFQATEVTEELGVREPADGERVVMVDAGLHAVDEIMRKHPESLLYGQDVGGELGGVFREAALLAKKYGDERVFNTPIMEAYIVGSTVGMSAVGCKPIVEVQFADYIWPGLNQLFTEASRSCYLTNGKWPVASVIRVPIGAYGSGGPYHSSSVESVLMQIKGVKVVYPSNAADLKGLMKAAYYDPNPVVILEHKGLYWSKVKGTDRAKTIEPDEAYILPLGKARVALEADPAMTEAGSTVSVITYGMGVHWAMNAAEHSPGAVEVIDLRSLNPLDEDAIYASVRKHNRCLVLTEETVKHSFSEALAGRIARDCFESLDAPVEVLGSPDTPAVPLNQVLERALLPSAEKVAVALEKLLRY